MSDPYYDQEGITLYLGESEKILPLLDVKLDAIITDPPYGIGFKYNSHDDSVKAYGGLEAYGKWLWEILQQGEAKCLPGSAIFVYQSILNVRWFSEWFPRDFRLFAGLKNFVQLRPTVMQHAWDPVVCWWTTGEAYSSPKGAINRDWHVAASSISVTETWSLSREHPSPKPVDQLVYLVRNWVKPRGAVLDPFLGSGTTALACYLQGRRCIGIEKDEQYLTLAIRRIEDARGAGAVTEMRKQISKLQKRKL